jgi:hypothetical protein
MWSLEMPEVADPCHGRASAKRNIARSVKYIEEHYGHVDISAMRRELTSDRQKVDRAISVIME